MAPISCSFKFNVLVLDEIKMRQHSDGGGGGVVGGSYGCSNSRTLEKHHFGLLALVGSRMGCSEMVVGRLWV